MLVSLTCTLSYAGYSCESFCSLEGVCASAETPSHRALGHVTDTSSSSINTQMSAPELPGFYFDAEKNRYFRLLPGHNNCNPLTREGLQREEQERRRLRLLEEEAASKSPRVGLNSTLLLQKRHLGLIPGNSYSSMTYRLSVGGNEMRNARSCVADQPGMLCSFKISTAWSCAWCLNPQADKNFSTGLSRRVIVTDAVTGRRQTYGVGSDVLAQQFALRAPILYNGGRSGEIFSIDLRQRARRGHGWKACRFYQESAITSVHVLQDENYLVAADMKGTIKLWDVRVTKAVRQYDGHHNEHAYLPLHVCEPEGLLLAVGQDCYTRLWSLGDGRLLRTIPSPHPASKDSVPSVVFSSQLGGRRGLPGLLMAVRHDLYHFPYSCDYGDGNALSKGC
nr:DDB1- and CUL4-associated factor 4-like [Paramormyrops kingsleyae]